MASDVAYAWLRQARSDLTAASNYYDIADAGTACQAVAKCQQVVEKSVKALVAALNDQDVIAVNTGFSHDVERLISVLIHVPRRPEYKDLRHRIVSLFYEGQRDEIRAISQFAPRRPDQGQLARRNTEYPYQNADGSWRAPADPNSFDDRDVRRFRQLAVRVHDGVSRIVPAAYRKPAVR